MSIITQKTKPYLVDPWKIQIGLNLLRPETSESRRWDENSNRYMHSQKRTHIQDKTDLIRAKTRGEMAWNGINKLQESDVEKQDDLIEALQKFQEATGIDEKKYIEEIQKCQTRYEIDNLEKKFKKAGTKWYKEKMLKSGAFEPVVNEEQALLEDEMNGLTAWFGKLPLYGDGAEMNMIETLKDLDKNLAIKKEFRTKLQKQTKFVKDEYARRLGSLALIGSKEQLLENILKEIKEVENAPSAVQYEFKKVQKKAGAVKDTATLKKTTLEKYNKIFGAYKTLVMQNLKYFGGEEVQSDYGKLPETALEFLEWMEERKNFAEMESAFKKLPALIKERKDLYEKRDEILSYALPEDRKKIEAKTHLMRRHELEAYIPELEQFVRNKNINVAKFMAEITVARVDNVELFQSFEKIMEIRKFRVADFETQEAKVLVLKQEIKDRAQTVKDYFKLPDHLRNDEEFLKANSFEREKILMEAKERALDEKQNPFDFREVDHLDNKEVETIEDKLDSKDGDKMMEDITKELATEGELEATKIQAQTYKRIFGTQKYAENKDMTQKERYLDDLKFWVRLDKNVKTENDVRTERQYNKWRYIEKADEAYDMRKVFTSGGEVRDLQTIKTNELKYGNTKVYEKLAFAKYGEHIMIEDETGRDALKPLKIIEDISTKELLKLVMMALTKLGQGKMHLSESNMSILKNSRNIKKDLAEKFINKQFSHLKMDKTKNQNELLNEIAL